MSSSPILVAVTRTVRPGQERRFEAALHDFVRASLNTPGQTGVQIIRPAPDTSTREYGILRRFASNEEKERFYRSDLFKQWEQRVVDLCEGPVRKATVTGLEAWFTLPGTRAVVPPPHWKMAITILLAVYPATLLLPWLLRPVVSQLPGWLSHLIVSASVVAALTWLAMPLLNRLLNPWLHPESRQSTTPAAHSAEP